MPACAPIARATSLDDPESSAVLITRPEPGASQTADRVLAIGLIPVLAPVLTVTALPQRLPDSPLSAILLTSGNAVNAFAPKFHPIPVFTVGDRTAERARAHGFTNVTSAGADATALIDLVARILRPDAGTLLLASGRGQGMALAADLRGRGYRVIRRAVYAATPVETLPPAAITAIRDGRIASALFFSAETARHCVRLLRAAGLADSTRRMDAFAIGQGAAVALGALPWRRILVAAQPNQDDMLALLR